jgi:lipopolysaccharide export system permease protein
MGAIDRYIFRTTLGAFVLILVSLTAFIWITQALREIDLMTNQGQTILVFIGMTGLLIPILVLIIAPIGFVVAVTYALNKLNADSEIVVISAAGVSPWRLFMPFLWVALLAAALVAFISAYLGPKGLRELRTWAAQLRADLVTTIVQPGRFTTLERGLTFHIRERRPNGELAGIFIEDRRDPKEPTTVIAERGYLLDDANGTFLVLEKGSVQRREEGQRDPTFVEFARYAFDLSPFTGGAEGRHITARERYLWDLAAPDPNDPLVKVQPGVFRAEFHDRIVAPLYPLAFLIIAYAFLGRPATTRESRATALGMAIVLVLALRFVGFGSTILAVQRPVFLVVLYGSLAAAIALGAVAISRGSAIEPPALVTRAAAAIAARVAPRTAPA